MHDYQRQRILTLLDPMEDPLGAGYHIIQSTIAIGSGGILGKGWLNGTQAQLDFVPERSTDFILAVFGEEFGLAGNVVLIVLYVLIIARGMMIAANASTVFSRLMAGAITLTFFTYAFVNMGMVSGILPVVGVPLPMISYGGTALLSILVGIRHPHVDLHAQAAGVELMRAAADHGARPRPRRRAHAGPKRHAGAGSRIRALLCRRRPAGIGARQPRPRFPTRCRATSRSTATPTGRTRCSGRPTRRS